MDQVPPPTAAVPATQMAQPTQQPAQAQNSGTAKIHFFDKANYDESLAVLVEFCGYVLMEAEKPEPLTREKLGGMLTVYVSNCMRQGPSPDVKVPEGATCQHQFSKGDRAGKFCGAKANNVGAADGLPKCSAHKNSKASKSAAGGGAATPSGASGQNFSYAASARTGKVAPQALTTIQAAISEQTAPAPLTLAQDADGRIYNPSTKILFQQRQDGANVVWVAYGVMEGPSSRKLRKMDVNLCWGNQWKWDPAYIEDEPGLSAHPLVIAQEDPLVNTQGGLVSRKIERDRKSVV